MTDKRKMSLVPPSVKEDDRLKAFIEEPDKRLENADKETTQASPKTERKTNKPKKTTKEPLYPWEAQGVTPEIIKPFVLRLKQPDKLKAEFIVDNSLNYSSLQDFCMKAVLNQIAKDLKKLEV